MYCTEVEQRRTREHWRFPWENSDADGGRYLHTGSKGAFLCVYLVVSQRPWYVTSWDKKTLSEFAGGDLFLSSNLDVCPSLLPIPSFSVH